MGWQIKHQDTQEAIASLTIPAAPHTYCLPKIRRLGAWRAEVNQKGGNGAASPIHSQRRQLAAPALNQTKVLHSSHMPFREFDWLSEKVLGHADSRDKATVIRRTWARSTLLRRQLLRDRHEKTESRFPADFEPAGPRTHL